ncbi:sigma-70 family RNA polymerase sigma factor [Verrucomicrobiaceae bacterium N1E253]|uniref:Sigma-70 family RNA polymerase sigma factor n=1 Tax=Oceaniferula marina TaxID=2748318 RepID=A0A851GK00_9BACT|nr:sigma-70 family RNA polymerase sigma factor [Oceaniferula marina]NWK57342.1 sigma-70 family RNA polymerase sigma factor [Oceaniferula marina]
MRDADDVIQEVNLVAWKKRKSYSPGTNFQAWIHTIIRYEVLRYWRDVRRSKEFAYPEDFLIMLLEESTVEITNEGLDQRYAHLKPCLSALKDEDRLLILQRYARSMSVGKLSEKIKRNPNSLRVSLHRIRSVLRRCMGKRRAQN